MVDRGRKKTVVGRPGAGKAGTACYVFTAVLLAVSGCGTSVHDEAAAGNVEKVRAMLVADPNLVDSRNPKGKTPLFYAVTNGRSEVVQVLFDFGASVNAADGTGLTPLHIAAWHNRAEQAGQLLEHGADIQARDAFGDTPLHSAAMHGRLEMIALLVRSGADPGAQNDEGLTPRELALAHRQEAAAAKLHELTE